MKVDKSYGTYFIIISFFLCFFMASVPCKAARKKNVIRVGCATTTGYHQKSKDGRITGYGYSYERLLAQYAGWEIEYVEGTWPGLQDKLEKGEIDLLGFLVDNPVRKKKYEFSKLSAGSSMSCLVAQKKNKKYSYQGYEAFDGMTVGCIKSNANIDSFLAYTKEKNFHVKIKYYGTYKEVFRGIDQGEIDAGLATNYQELSSYSVIDQFLPVDFYYCVKKGNISLVEEVNDAMSKIDSYYTNIEEMLYSQYYDSTNGMNAAFTKEELDYLATKPVVKVVPCGRKIPFEEYDKDSKKYIGIVPEILEKITESTGIKFEYVKTEDRWLYQKKDLGENVITCFSEDTDWVQDKELDITQPFLESTVSVIQKEIPKGYVTVAVQKGIFLEYLVKKEHPEWKIHYYKTKEDCLDAVRSGEVSCTVLNSYEADYLLSKGKYLSLRDEAMTGVVQNIGFGVTKKSNQYFLSILSKAMLMIPSDEYDAIIRTNANKTAQASVIDLVYENPIQFFGMALLIGLLLVVTVGLLLYARAMNRKNKQIVEANAAKSDFLSRVSHDLRTPMNAIINLTDMVETEIDDKDAALEDIGKIKTSNQFLLSLINDVLDVTKMEEKKMELHPERYSYQEFLNYIHSTFEPLCEEKKIQFQVEKGTEDVDIMMDKVRFNQLCFNLLSNAVKYTPQGGNVIFRMKHGTIKNHTLPCDIYVEDNGVGMTKEFQEKMCEPFSQEGREYLAVEGTGLGLYIVKEIVELLDGTIEIQSEVNQGTIVHVRLLMQLAEKSKKTESAAVEPKALKGKNILVAEDHQLNAEIVNRLLEKVGCHITNARDGKQAVDIFQGSDVNTYDIILMDIRMPVMNGIDATKIIRSLEREDAKKVVIIAMTANAYDHDVKECIEAGMNAHLAKPIKPELMYEVMVSSMEASKTNRYSVEMTER